jgi:hypothetical protein
MGLSKGNFNWAGNEKHIELLHEDIAHEGAYRVVDRIDSVGWHELPKSVTPLRGRRSARVACGSMTSAPTRPMATADA